MATAKRPLRASDLKPGHVYLSPAGHKCLLLPQTDNGLSRTSYLFAYVVNGKADRDDGFQLLASNATAIAAMREVA